MRQILLYLLLAGASLRAGQASVTLFSAASETQPWLSVSVDPRSAALGDAMVASSDDLHALSVNPAGLSQLVDQEIVLVHNEWDSALGLRQEYASYGGPYAGGGAAIGFNYFSFGSFDNLDSNGALINSSNDSAFALSLGYGSSWLNGALNWGLGVEGAQENLGGDISSLYVASLGLQYDIWKDIWLGADASNVQLNNSGDGQAPQAYQAGVAWEPLEKSLILNAEGEFPAHDASSWRCGAEWNFLSNYFLRAGYRVNNGDSSELDSGFSAGAGLKLGPLQFDYAYVPYGSFSNAQRIGLTLNLSAGLFSSNIVIESTGVTQNAQTEYSNGLAAYKTGDWYVAKVSLDLALKIYPNFANAEDAKRLLLDIDKKIANDKSHGMTPEQKAKIDSRLAEAKKLLENDDPVGARKEVEAVLEFDSTFKDAVALLNAINTHLNGRLNTLKQQAMTALSQNDLRSAVLAYRKILSIDDSDPDANDNLRKLSPRIHTVAQQIYHQGIDAYVAGDLQKAISLWQETIEIDPSTQEQVHRDISKAQKLLELNSGGK